MGIDQTLAPERIQIGSNKILSNEPKMPFINVHHFLIGPEPLPKKVHTFLGHYGFLN